MFTLDVIIGLLVPFAGTSAGAALVFFMKNNFKASVQKALTGFAAGVMVAASIWSLLVPAMEQSDASLGKLAFLPAVVGFWLGIFFLLLIDSLTPHMHMDSKTEGLKSNLARTTMMVLAVVIHNIPEGMAVGVVFAGFSTGNHTISLGAALALSIGIAIQNFPEGAIISMPLHSAGESKSKAFFNGVLSGAVEPVAAFITILLAKYLVPTMPYLLSFAAGAMLYVVVEELIPEMAMGEKHTNIGVILFALGFTLMMALDVALG